MMTQTTINKPRILSHGAGRYSVTTHHGQHIASDLSYDEARKIARNTDARARRAARKLEMSAVVEQDTVECIYCGHDTPDDGDGPVPSHHDDDAAWAAMAPDHAPDCEWIATRAHRID